jgi:hypothetical protein
MFGMRFSRALAITTIASLVMATAAFADNLQVNDLGTTGGTSPLVVTRGSVSGATIDYRIAANSGDGQMDCNAADATPATVNIVGLPAGASATGNLTFTSCGVDQTATITASTSTTLGDYAITATVSDGGTGTYNTNPANFTLRIVAGADSAPPTNTSITIDDGAAWSNNASGGVSVDISSTDNVGIAKYRLAESQAALATALDVAVSPAEASFARANVAFTLSGAQAASKEVWVRVYDAAGLTAEASDTIGWDHTAPTVAYTGATPAANGAGWNNTAVTATFTATDGLSGFGSPASSTSTGTASSSGEGASVVVNSPPFTDNAGNTAAVGAASATFKIDLTDPSVSITSPADGTSTIASSVLVNGTASDTPSGIAAVTVNGGAAVFSSSTGEFARTVPLACGSNSISATATDVADRTSTSSAITVTRVCFTGLQYYQPLDQTTGAAVLNVGKYGRVIPVKVTASVFGAPLTDAVLVANGWTLQIGVNPVSCSGGTATDTVEAYADAGASAAGTNLFRWDNTAQQFIYNLDTKTPPGVEMAIGTCYRLDVYVSDGTNKVKISETTYAIFKPVK